MWKITLLLSKILTGTMTVLASVLCRGLPYIIATRTLSKTVMSQVSSLGRHGKLSTAAAKTVSVARFATVVKITDISNCQ